MKKAVITSISTAYWIFNQDSNPTVSSLDVSRATILWYDENGEALSPTTLLVDGATYYATSRGELCESSDTLEITVNLTINSAIPTMTNADCFQACTLLTNGRSSLYIDCIDAYPSNRVEIIDPSGRVISTISGYTNASEQLNLTPGTYFFRLTIDEIGHESRGLFAFVK